MVATPADGNGDDPARTVLMPPFTRANRLAMLSRGETGALVALAALILGRRQEAVMVELTVGVAAIKVPHPRTGPPCAVAEVPITEVEVVLDADVDGRPGLATGWGASLGTVERRAISLALLDGAMQADGELQEPFTLDEQTVIAATDGPATNGFVEHLRLPHYASFAAYLALRPRATSGRHEPATAATRDGRGARGRTRPSGGLRVPRRGHQTQCPPGNSQGTGHSRLAGAVRVARDAGGEGLGQRRSAGDAVGGRTHRCREGH